MLDAAQIYLFYFNSFSERIKAREAREERNKNWQMDRVQNSVTTCDSVKGVNQKLQAKPPVWSFCLRSLVSLGTCRATVKSVCREECAEKSFR